MLKIQETWVRALGREDPQEESMATHSSILEWKNPMDGAPGGQHSKGWQRVRHNRATKHTAAIVINFTIITSSPLHLECDFFMRIYASSLLNLCILLAQCRVTAQETFIEQMNDGKESLKSRQNRIHLSLRG